MMAQKYYFKMTTGANPVQSELTHIQRELAGWLAYPVASKQNLNEKFIWTVTDKL